MAFEQVTGAVSQYIPNINVSGFFTTVTWFFIIILVIGGVGIGAYLFLQRMSYNNQIRIFETVAGKTRLVYKDTAKELALKNSLGTIFKLRKYKHLGVKGHIPKPDRQMGIREYWFFRRSDGELINFDMGNIDLVMLQARVEYTHQDMKLANSELAEHLDRRYTSTNFWKEHAVLIMSVGFIAIIGIMTWLLFDKWIDLANATNEGVKVAGEVMKQANAILGNIDNIQSGGSGIVNG